MSLITYVKNVRAEMKHVVWPSNRQTVSLVGVVILVSAIAGLIVAGFDFGFTAIAERIVAF
jgi:preprotein translocase subunit SecE